MSPREIVEGIESGNWDAEEALYGILADGFLRRFRKTLGVEDAEDLTHQAFITVLIAARTGRIRQPERLMGFVDCVCRNARAAHFRRRPHCALDFDIADPGSSGAECRLDRERMEAWLYRTLAGLQGRYSEILVRYYLCGQGEAEICEATGLKATTFRTIKRRGIERMRSRLPHRFFRGRLPAA